MRPTPLPGGQLFEFRDDVTGLWMRFYRPATRYDLWKGYVTGVTRTYRSFGAEKALSLPVVTSESLWPIFAVLTDREDNVLGGWYINGPLTAVNEAFAPSEFAADPISATLIAEWISQVLPQGAIELKAGWVDSTHPARGALADAIGRSVIHSLHMLEARYAFATAAEHATRRWQLAGGCPLPGIAPTPYPDERYSTHFYHWDSHTAFDIASPAQQDLFLLDLKSTPRALVTSGGPVR
jgi:hypothetical protein